jgi:hypothetical protein
MRFSPFLPQKDDVANQVMMCHRVSRFRVKHEKTTGFQGKMDFRNTPIGDAIFLPFFPRIVSNPCKKQLLTLANEFAPSGVFLFAVIFCDAKNGITHFTVGCRRFAPALRRAAPSSSNPNLRINQICIYKIDQARPSGVRDISRRHVCRWVAVASLRRRSRYFRQVASDSFSPAYALWNMPQTPEK